MLLGTEGNAPLFQDTLYLRMENSVLMLNKYHISNNIIIVLINFWRFDLNLCAHWTEGEFLEVSY